MLLLAIADRGDDHGLAYPGVEYLAKKSRMTPRNVFNTIKKAVESGELVVFSEASPYGTNIYQIILPGLHTEKFSVGQAQAILEAEAEGKRPPISMGEEISGGDEKTSSPEKSSLETSPNPLSLKSFSDSFKNIDSNNEESDENSSPETSDAERLGREAADTIIGWGEMQSKGPGGKAFDNTPEYLEKIIREFSKVWCDLYGFQYSARLRSRFIEESVGLYDAYGSVVADAIYEAGTRHHDAGLDIGGPASLEYVIVKVMRDWAGQEERIQELRDYYDLPDDWTPTEVEA